MKLRTKIWNKADKKDLDLDERRHCGYLVFYNIFKPVFFF